MNYQKCCTSFTYLCILFVLKLNNTPQGKGVIPVTTKERNLFNELMKAEAAAQAAALEYRIYKAMYK